MAHLIIGHTTETTARVWVRGSRWHRRCEITLDPADSTARRIRLSGANDYCGVVQFDGLTPGRRYAVTASFSLLNDGFPGLNRSVSGSVRTIQRPEDGQRLRFSFVLSSCNLSIVSINDLLALVLATGGTAVAARSLGRLPLERWRWPGLRWVWAVLRYPAKIVLWIVAWFVKTMTSAKQPGPPYLRSPFLKLAAVFESTLVELCVPEQELPAVGDQLITASGRGVVASSCEPGSHPRDDRTAYRTWRVVLTFVQGVFEPCQRAFRLGAGKPERDRRRAGVVLSSAPGLPWHDPPSFFLHAGDQIYYDFPWETRKPRRTQYRLAYREAWFDDEANRRLLASWPHYMVLDDHEIADQFARDFTPVLADTASEKYRAEATIAYREYVHARNPDPDESRAGATPDSFWYRFDVGGARFFTLDTRTQRFDHGSSPRMIDERQMEVLLEWMRRYRHDLKFVVTSVPFVAEIDEGSSRPVDTWYEPAAEPTATESRAPRNHANDKWSAPRFQRQRDQIIEHIARQGIEHVVFLTGDMHCCYHASMRIGEGSKYACTTIHELGAGPANQLQLANVAEFASAHRGRTSGSIPYEVLFERFHGEVSAVMHVAVEYK